MHLLAEVEGTTPGAIFAAVNGIVPMPLGGVIVLAFDPALTVELEAISALVEPMEFWWRWITGHRNTSSHLPAAILGTLSLKGSLL